MCVRERDGIGGGGVMGGVRFEAVLALTLPGRSQLDKNFQTGEVKPHFSVLRRELFIVLSNVVSTG